MEQEIIKFAIGQGIFCVLFVWLFMRTTKRNEEREDKLMAHNDGYQKVLGEISSAVSEMRHDINRIEDRLNERA
ncbi:hypothetical protein JJB07_14950 [Tumebacillus sp. ITR2]|uniref:Bacteriocin n=1 Tax=Tumebacillus amylolyticus TaxID=2801339 RepID=A0ABS1JCD5_9BACL|nr:hypothetical protein [Tumebacillus amylolyticus]